MYMYFMSVNIYLVLLTSKPHVVSIDFWQYKVEVENINIVLLKRQTVLLKNQ